jgi:RNA polymerase sigma-70 factor (ECF subfamily)
MGLPEAQRVTAMLVFVEGYTYREASEALEVPIGTIMSRISVARKKLAEDIAVELQESGT